MKKIIFLILLLAMPHMVHSAQSWPASTGYVNDFANVIPSDKARAMEWLLGELEKKTGAQVAIVTVPTVEGADINGAAVDLFKAWGIGQKGKDNGVLILAAINDHRAKIEVGYGLEGIITDGTAGDILRQSLIPQFKEGDYGQGLTNACFEVARLIAKDEGVTLDGQVSRPNDDPDQGGVDPRFIYLIIFIVYIIFKILFWNSGRRSGFWGGGFYGGGWGGGSGGFGGGGSGFGGFGGGGSGGGGASGSW